MIDRIKSDLILKIFKFISSIFFWTGLCFVWTYALMEIINHFILKFKVGPTLNLMEVAGLYLMFISPISLPIIGTYLKRDKDDNDSF